MNPLQFLRNLPIKRKLMFVVLATCAVILLLVCTSLFGLQLYLFKKSAARDLVALAEVVAGNSTGSVSFGDKKAAEEILTALKSRPQVVAVGIRLPDGSRWVHLGTQDELAPAGQRPTQGGVYFRDRDCYVTQPILLKDEVLGTLDVRANFAATYRDLANFYALILTAVLAVSLLVAAVLSTRLQRLISVPIQQLASVVRVVTEQKDYSIRAQKLGRDEVGLLTEAFNDMLSEIQARDAALERLSQKKFESLVNSIDGIVWERDAETIRFAFVSEQSVRLLGYTPEEWVATPRFWQGKLHPEDAAQAEKNFHDAVAARQPYRCEYRMIAADGNAVWILESGVVLAEPDQPVTVRGIFQDITEQKEAAAELDNLNHRLVETSRHAGMAEVATGVLHNVGNVLNSVNVSVTLVRENFRHSEISSLIQVAALLRQHEADFGKFITTDPKGKMVPSFIIQLAEHLEQEHVQLKQEHERLGRNIEHIKEIVAMQQNYAQVSGFSEKVALASLVDDVLQIHTGGLERHCVQVRRQYEEVPQVTVDRHKVLQILVNLVHNAKYALEASGRADRLLTVGIAMNGGQRVKVTVQDNGIGIPPENLTRIFSHGFTTRKGGHGFGLHSGANAAREMGGLLFARSEGLGHGAAFTLELPSTNEQARP